MRKYFLGAAARFTHKERLAHLFAVGQKKDLDSLKAFLSKKYDGEAVLTKNGRSGLALALKAYFKPGDSVIVNGFTCFAVYEAVKEAKLKPLFVDINKDDLNFDLEKLKNYGDAKGIIIQNTFGNPVDIVKIEEFAKTHQMMIIEDLAHCAGIKYCDGREAGTVGIATALSFGKDKSIDTTSGGAVIFRRPPESIIKAPSKPPKLSDTLRARFYPLFGLFYRGLSYIHLNGAFMRLLLAIHWVEKSADNSLDLDRRISKFEAKLALKQLKKLKRSGEPPIREYYLVEDRDKALRELAQANYNFGGFWYERPVSPERYYKKVHFPEDECKTAVYVSKHIVNLPTYYSKKELELAKSIINKNLVKEGRND